MGRPRVAAQTVVPGAYERMALPPRRPICPELMDAVSIAERDKEGGGAANQRRYGRAATPRRAGP